MLGRLIAKLAEKWKNDATFWLAGYNEKRFIERESCFYWRKNKQILLTFDVKIVV